MDNRYSIPQDSFWSTGWQCDFNYGYGHDMLEEEALNKKYCMQVLAILITKADAEIDELERDLVSLQSELAWAEHEEWSEICCGALRKKIDHLHLSLRSLTSKDKNEVEVRSLLQRRPAERLHEIVKALLRDLFQEKDKQDEQVLNLVCTGSDSPGQAAQHLEGSTKRNSPSSTASKQEEVEDRSITSTENTTISETSFMVLEKRIKSSDTVELEDTVINASSQSSSLFEAGCADKKKLLSSSDEKSNASEKGKEQGFTAEDKPLIQNSFLNCRDTGHDLEVTKPSHDISKDVSGNAPEHAGSPVNKKKELSTSDSNITSEEVEENSAVATADIVILDTSLDSIGKSTELDKREKLETTAAADSSSSEGRNESGTGSCTEMTPRDNSALKVNGNEEVEGRNESGTGCCTQMTPMDNSAPNVNGSKEVVTSFTGKIADFKYTQAEGRNEIGSGGCTEITPKDNSALKVNGNKELTSFIGKITDSKCTQAEGRNESGTGCCTEMTPMDNSVFKVNENEFKNAIVQSVIVDSLMKVTSSLGKITDSKCTLADGRNESGTGCCTEMTPIDNSALKVNGNKVTDFTGKITDSKCTQAEVETSSITPDAMTDATGLNGRIHNSDSGISISRQIQVEISDMIPALEPPPGFDEKRDNSPALKPPPGFEKKGDSSSALDPPPGFDKKRDNSDSRLVAFEQEKVGNCDLNQKLCDFTQKAARKRGIKGSNFNVADKSESSFSSSDAEGKNKTSYFAKVINEVTPKQADMPAQEAPVAATADKHQKLNLCLPVKTTKQNMKRKVESHSQNVENPGSVSGRLVSSSSLEGKMIIRHGQSDAGQHGTGLSDNIALQPQKKRKENSGLSITVEVKSADSHVSNLQPVTNETYREIVVYSQPSFTDRLKNMKVGELRALAKQNKLTRYSKLKKDDLIELITRNGGC